MKHIYKISMLLLITSTAHSRGIDDINLSITDVFPTADIEVNTPVAVRFSWTEIDAIGTVTISSGTQTQTCTATLPLDS